MAKYTINKDSIKYGINNYLKYIMTSFLQIKGLGETEKDRTSGKNEQRL